MVRSPGMPDRSTGSVCRARAARCRGLALAWIVGMGCASRPAHEAPMPTVQLDPCRVDGIPFAARCGEVEVPEDRDVDGGRTIGLRVVVVPARGRDPKPDPLFMLAGGPGQAATEVFGPVLGALEELTLERDIVLVDQRGTGSSGPLDCPPPGESLAERLDPEAGFAELEACRTAFEADLTKYTTPIAMDDLDRVRGALGYARINLLGGSYGTRAALVYMRRHPDRVRAAILDGNAPPSASIPVWFARDAQRALDAVFRDCATEPGCAGAFPDAAGDFQRLLDRLRAEPARTTVHHPRTRRKETVTIDADVFAAGVRGLLYAPDLAALLPLAVDDALGGDFQPLVAQWSALGDDAVETMSVGMMLAVLCAEDVSRMTEADIESATRGTFLGRAVVDQFRRACEVWPRGQLPAGYWGPVVSDIPALVLSGDLDPVTPPAWGEDVVATLSQGRHVVVPGAGHGTTTTGCVPELLERFLETADATALDTSCLEEHRRPKFFIDHAGPEH